MSAQSFGIRSQKWLTLVALLVAGFMLFGELGRLPLIHPDEGRNATVAREMKESGAWLVPTFNGLSYLDKPAFFFKCSALCMSLFGESECAARLPSALAGLALLGLVYAFCRREFGSRCAALAVIVTATTPLYFVFARLVIMDMMLAFFVSAAILAGYQAEQHEGRVCSRWYWIGAAAAGFATLVKGPVGFILPVLVLLAFHFIERRRSAWKRMLSPWNFVVFFAIVLPWFVGVSLARPDFPQYGLMNETLGRFTTSMHHRWQPMYYYAGVIAFAFLAWSILLPGSASAAWRVRKRWTSAERLCVVWAVVVVVFFSLSHSKLPGYVLTVAVAVGVLTARVFERAFENGEGHAARIVRHATVALLAGLALAWMVLMVVIAYPNVGERVSPKHYDVLMEVGPQNPILIASCLLVLALCAGAVWKREPRFAFAAFAVLPMMLPVALFDTIKQYAEARSARALASRLLLLPTGVDVALFYCFPSSLPFYLKQPIPILDDNADELASNYVAYTLRHGTNCPSIIVRECDWENWLNSRPRPVCLVSTKRRKLLSLVQSRGVAVNELAPGYWTAVVPPPGPS